MKQGSVLFLLLLLFSGEAQAFMRGPHRLSIGPECAYVERKREGGTKQKGVLTGGRILYDRLKYSGIYWAAEGYWIGGRLNGHSGGGSELLSHKRDSEIEGRLGYNFRMCYLRRYIWLTPFVAGGYFEGINRFKDPSPLEVTFRNTYQYMGAGALFKIELTSCFSFGIEYKMKFPIEPRSAITDDPDFDDETLIVEEKWIYDANFPITYSRCCKKFRLEASLIPFYRFRHYGGHMNYPFDFIDTKFNLYGARLMFSCSY